MSPSLCIFAQKRSVHARKAVEFCRKSRALSHENRAIFRTSCGVFSPLGTEPLPPQQRATGLHPPRHLTARQPATHALFTIYRTHATIDSGTRQIDRAHTLYIIGRPRLGPPAAASHAVCGFRPYLHGRRSTEVAPSPHPPTVHRL